MKSENKIIIIVAVIATAVVLISAYYFLNAAFVPLEQREEKTSTAVTKNVEIEIATFNGNIEIQTTTSSTVEVTYNVETPQGHLNEITTSTMNQTQSDDRMTLIAEAKLVNTNNELTVNYRADILIKLPDTSQYNLTLTTLNGNIIKPLLNDTKIVANTSNGAVEIKDDNCKIIEASSLNGNVKVSLAEGTLFQVDASTANGNVAYQGIAMNTSVQTTTHLKGETSEGQGNLDLTLSAANGNIILEYFSK
jgi:DUF4097 and DUF4098 domain-containing protein YvlB